MHAIERYKSSPRQLLGPAGMSIIIITGGIPIQLECVCT